MTTVRVAYICDQEKDCGRFSHCQKDCFHTFNGLHAKHGIIKDRKELESARFRKCVTTDEATYYEEVTRDESDD